MGKVKRSRQRDSHVGPPKRILFVCVENSCRSQMAEAFARIHGAGRV
ncbi:MAG: ArsR family transcriptional regulator, partial [Acidobacteria bacterium]|nr:ArsR family transcriptional regulator [Acidobacteriota bacterium]